MEVREFSPGGTLKGTTMNDLGGGAHKIEREKNWSPSPKKKCNLTLAMSPTCHSNNTVTCQAHPVLVKIGSNVRSVSSWLAMSGIGHVHSFWSNHTHGHTERRKAMHELIVQFAQVGSSFNTRP